ncbi:MAG: response regulator [Burkholderiaceae bacterium]|nr:MAG: response regulator [Burkholderiaceae bacterium]
MRQKKHILLVDDEPMNLEILSEYLNLPEYHLTCAENGAQAWDCLQQAPQPFDAIVLDRMMPVMNGMELLVRIKADPHYADLPIVMQTAAAGPEQIAEGLQAGAYYYLSKPYESAVLRSILEAALKQQGFKQNLHEQIRRRDGAIALLDFAQFSFQTLHQAQRLAGLLASLCPDPEKAVIGLAELLINAVEHGNLAITYEEKSRLHANLDWEAEVERRLQDPRYAARRALVEYRRTPAGLIFTIRDEGAGFVPDKYLEMCPRRAFDSHGRGIAMARALSFSRLEYRGRGNVVVAEIALPVNRSVVAVGGQQRESVENSGS